MIHFIDISNWQSSLNLSYLVGQIGGVALKATEGLSFVDPYCDGWFQQAKHYGLLRAFYHFAGNSTSPDDEARYFYENTKNYFGDAVPVLDWEGNQNVEWVNRWVRWIHEESGVWTWIYANPWRFNQGGVETNCMRWVASYPSVVSPSFAQAETWDCPIADGLVGAWQFCSDGRLQGYDGNLDCNLFYGDAKQWEAYYDSGSEESATPDVQTLENNNYKVTIERK